jgi:hypothetical protein
VIIARELMPGTEKGARSGKPRVGEQREVRGLDPEAGMSQKRNRRHYMILLGKRLNRHLTIYVA